MSERQTFAERVLAGKVYDLDTIEDDIAAWHKESGAGCKLHEWLGLTLDEFGLFVEQPTALRAIFAARKYRMNVVELLQQTDGAVLLAARGSSPEETQRLAAWLKTTGRM